MTTLFDIAVTNAVIAVPLAILACLVGRVARRPALTHALWIVVLLKLVTPPMFHLSVPISLPAFVQSATSEMPIAGGTGLKPDQGFPTSEAVAASSIATDDALGQVESVTSSSTDSSLQAVEVSQIPRNDRNRLAGVWEFLIAPFLSFVVVLQRTHSAWGALLANIWIGGILVTFGVQAGMVIRFGRRVSAVGIHDESLQQQTERLAVTMGLRRCPEVRVVAATVSPMLWSCGARTRLLFPQELMNRLDCESRETLLIHELAHFGRGDHWVRCLEFLATSLFWWHPVVWCARHQIEESEEECCDAWVVDQIHQNPRRYAEALLDTIDFLCGVPMTVPPMASGLGNASFLRRRLTNIMRGVSPKSMSHRVRAAVVLLTALLLPIQPFVFGSISRAPLSFSASVTELRPVAIPHKSPNEEPQSMLLTNVPLNDPGSALETGSQTLNESTMTRPATSPKPRVLRGEKVWSNAVSSDGRFVVQATTGRRVLLNDLHSNRESDLSPYGITAVSFTPDGRQFVAVTNDGQVMLWDAEKSLPTRVLYTHNSGLRSASVSPDGDAVVVGGQDGTLLVLDLETGQSLTQLSRQSMPVNCVRFSPDASRVAVALGEWNSNDRGQVRLISLQTGTSEIFACDTAPGAITFVSNDELIIGQWNGHATLWNLIQHKIVGAANADKSVIAAVSFSPDNPQLREIAFESLGSSGL